MPYMYNVIRMGNFDPAATGNILWLDGLSRTTLRDHTDQGGIRFHATLLVTTEAHQNPRGPDILRSHLGLLDQRLCPLRTNEGWNQLRKTEGM